MESHQDPREKRNLVVLAGQRTLATIAWTMASPAVVLPYLAISLNMPVFLAGFLISIRRAGNLGSTLLSTNLAARRGNRKADISASDVVIAMCYVLALASVAVDSGLLIAAMLIAAVLLIGLTEEYQNLISWDFLADTLRPDNRQLLSYAAITIGGIGAIMLTWLSQIASQQQPALTQHTLVIAIAVVCFIISAASILLVRENKKQASATNNPPGPQGKLQAAWMVLKGFSNSLRELLSMRWFRKFVLIRIALQTVELSVPFFAILAAVAHGASHKGLTALIISSAAAMVVAGPIWRFVGHVSNAAVMGIGALLAAIAGVFLTCNYHWQLVDNTIAHSAALFLVMVGTQGVSTARSLYYLDSAPEAYRVSGMAMSKSIVRIVGFFLATGVALLAHSQHPVWAVLFVAALNLLTAAFVYLLSSESKPDMRPA
ncbi:MAG: MFS transporter [Pseudomonadota bacterium]